MRRLAKAGEKFDAMIEDRAIDLIASLLVRLLWPNTRRVGRVGLYRVIAPAGITVDDRRYAYGDVVELRSDIAGALRSEGSVDESR